MARDGATGPPGPPRRIGRCEIVRQLGRGGQGNVYEGRMIEDRPYAKVGERVAVKIFGVPETAPGGVRDPRRVEEELWLGQRVDHAAVMRVFEMGSEGEGEALRQYLVMEYVPGTTLKERIRAEALLPEDEVRCIGVQLASGLQAIHLHALHRDVKPGNVIDTGENRVKLVDLGLACRLSGSNITTDNAPPGSLHYMAPERLTGAACGPRRSR